jgi:hypothetical protein
MQRYLVKGMFFKLAMALFLALFIYFAYGFGDTMSYFREAMEIRQFISDGKADFGILFKDLEYARDNYDIIGGAESGWFVEKITLILSYAGFGSFLATTMLFAVLAYAGMFRMFEAFADMMPEWHFRVAIIVLFFPTVVIYGSGILKDTICISALGWIVYYSHLIFIKRKMKLRYLFVIGLCSALIIIVKVYILAAFIIPFLMFVVINMLKTIKNKFVRRIIQPIILGVIVILYFALSQQIQLLLGYYATEKLVENVAEQQKNYKAMEGESGSFFEIGPMEKSISGLIKKTPAGIVATLYRPFIWESKNIMMLFSAIESFLISLFTLYVIFKTGIFKFLHFVFSDPFVFLCIFFSLLFAAFVGVSTLNFGTLGRYRIPILPFYLAGLLYSLYKSQVAHFRAHQKNVIVSTAA